MPINDVNPSLDEMDLFDDDQNGNPDGSGEGAGAGAGEGALAGELDITADGAGAGDAGNAGEGEGDGTGKGGAGAGSEGEEGNIDGEGNVIAPTAGAEDLSGIELFLSDYGVKGGLIEFEDGTSSHFNDLGAPEQENILKSLTENGRPTIEDKFNLDDGEITLINAFRESGLGDVGEFLNNVVNDRVGALINQEDALGINFDNIQDEDLYIMHLKEKNPELPDEQIADELNKAKELITFKDTIGSLRDGYKSKQQIAVSEKTKQDDASLFQEVEAQREEIAEVVSGIDDVAGAVLSDDIKEFLLTDIMELNDNNDPILMEKIFSDPENMFKVNWFLNYGEDYITNLNDYWKKQVSKAYKNGYSKSLNGMPRNPTIIGADNIKRNSPASHGIGQTSGRTFGETVSEEELFGE